MKDDVHYLCFVNQCDFSIESKEEHKWKHLQYVCNEAVLAAHHFFHFPVFKNSVKK